MRCDPARPAPERSPIAVDWMHAYTFVAEEGCLDENEAEACAELGMVEERAHLGAEDGGIDAAAMKTEEAG